MTLCLSLATTASSARVVLTEVAASTATAVLWVIRPLRGHLLQKLMGHQLLFVDNSLLLPPDLKMQLTYLLLHALVVYVTCQMSQRNQKPCISLPSNELISYIPVNIYTVSLLEFSENVPMSASNFIYMHMPPISRTVEPAGRPVLLAFASCFRRRILPSNSLVNT